MGRGRPGDQLVDVDLAHVDRLVDRVRQPRDALLDLARRHRRVAEDQAALGE